MFNVASSRLTNELFERALGDSLQDFPRIPWLKEEQKRCLQSMADKKDVFGILPTGFGKSLIFQLLQRLSRELWKLKRTMDLVVTPLVAIMKDQVEGMNRLGWKTFGIGLGDERSKCDLLSSMSDVDIDVVYGSPESWCSPKWSKALKNGFLWKQTVCLIVDEAHAVSAC